MVSTAIVRFPVLNPFEIVSIVWLSIVVVLSSPSTTLNQTIVFNDVNNLGIIDDFNVDTIQCVVIGD